MDTLYIKIDMDIDRFVSSISGSFFLHLGHEVNKNQVKPLKRYLITELTLQQTTGFGDFQPLQKKPLVLCELKQPQSQIICR